MAGEMWGLSSRPLGKAILEDDLQTFRELLANGENPKLMDRKGNTYLHLIATTFSPKVFHSLVSTGIDVQAQNKHGNTALHVSAIHNEAGHVCDLMMSGVDPTLLNMAGLRAIEISTANRYWRVQAEHYEPGLFQAIERHDAAKVDWLLRQWCRTDTTKDERSARQFAARFGFHDLVALIDRYKTPLDFIYSLLEVDTPRLLAALQKGACDLNFAREGAVLTHPLQIAMRLGSEEHLRLLCRPPRPELPPADVNAPARALGYCRGPVYFEAVAGWATLGAGGRARRLRMLQALLDAGADLRLRDGRARTLAHCLVERLDDADACAALLRRCLSLGADLASRDGRGRTVREAAEARGLGPAVEEVDWAVVRLVRASDVAALRDLTVAGYRELRFELKMRDTATFAAGNDDPGPVTELLGWADEFAARLNLLHRWVRDAALLAEVEAFLGQVEKSCREERRRRAREKRLRFHVGGEEEPEAPILEEVRSYLLGKDRGGRCCLHLALLSGNAAAVELLWRYQQQRPPPASQEAQAAANERPEHGVRAEENETRVNFLAERDNFGRNPLHYAACGAPEHRQLLSSARWAAETAARARDVFWRLPDDYASGRWPGFLEEERSRPLELWAEELRLLRIHQRLLDAIADDLPPRDKAGSVRGLLTEAGVKAERLDAAVEQARTRPHRPLLAAALEAREWPAARLLGYHGAAVHAPMRLRMRQGEEELSAVEFCRRQGNEELAQYLERCG